MKKNYLLSALAVCACLFTACNKENDTTKEEGAEENKEGVITYLRATGNENTSKGSIDGATGDFSWNVGDQIAVWDNTNGVYKVSAELTAGDIAGDNATFAFVDLGTRADFAISPASIVDAGHHTAADFSITLPGTYSLADVLGEKSPVPMIAVNDGEFLHFKQLGALLRVTLNNLPPSTKSVTIDFNGKKVQGAFSVAASVTPGTSTIVTSATEGTDDIITINIGDGHGWLNDQDVNIPVPTGTYTNITVKSWSGLNGTGTNTLTMTRPIKVASGIADVWKPIRTSARKVIASLPVFTISTEPDVRVQIAPANLIWTGSAWALHENAYDATFGQITTHLVQNYYEAYTHASEYDEQKKIDDPTGYAAAVAQDDAERIARNEALKNTVNRDLFQWEEVQGATPLGVSFGMLAGHNDWRLGASFANIRNASRGTTLSAKVILPAGEFPDRTVTNRSNTNKLYNPRVTAGGTPGCFLFPDNWDDNLNTTTIANNTYAGKHYITNNDPPTVIESLLATEITMTVFNQLLDAGAVFIPMTGLASVNGWFSSVGLVGGTWTSTSASETSAKAFFPATGSISTNGSVGKTQYRSVRLVRDVN